MVFRLWLFVGLVVGLVVVLVVGLVAATPYQLGESEYREMPRLFHLDDYDTCLSRSTGAYCVGSFALSGSDNQLFDRMTEFSKFRHSFNHTLLHRGLCISSRCRHIKDKSSRKFSRCVDEWTRRHYGLSAKLEVLEYCKTGRQSRVMPVDAVDWIFAGIVAAILVMNAIGTAYHYFSKNDNLNKYLASWSVISSFKRLIARYEDGDPRLSALRPLQGAKCFTLILIAMAHTCFSHYLTYLQNPEYLEKAAQHPLSTYFHNGSIIVQTFILISSFLLTYNVFLYLEKNPKIKPSFSMLPKSIFLRLIRISPVYMFVVGASATWWRFVSDGPMWTALVEKEALRCREKWWTQALYINNFLKVDHPCLIQTWFLAVDMQLYIVSVLLTIVFCKYPNNAVRHLSGLFLLSVVAIFAASWYWNLKPMLFLMLPEKIRSQFFEDVSFKWLYIAPWGSLPASILGVLFAFFYHHLMTSGFKPEASRLLRVSYDVFVPMVFLWILLGCVIDKITNPFLITVFAALDRTIFVIMLTLASLPMLFKMDGFWLRFLSWRGFQISGRLCLSFLMVHWCFNLTQVAQRSLPTYTSVFDIGGDWLLTCSMSYLTAVLLYLFLEVPSQKFIQAVFE